MQFVYFCSICAAHGQTPTTAVISSPTASTTSSNVSHTCAPVHSSAVQLTSCSVNQRDLQRVGVFCIATSATSFPGRTSSNHDTNRHPIAPRRYTHIRSIMTNPPISRQTPSRCRIPHTENDTLAARGEKIRFACIRIYRVPLCTLLLIRSPFNRFFLSSLLLS